jgi:ribulose-bisphosphate carboxylase large chain
MTDRFTVRYRIAAADEVDARARARAIALEQTVEIPEEVVPPGFIAEEIVGRIEALQPAGSAFEATISYSDDCFGDDFVQALNVIFGNSSIKEGIRVTRIGLSQGLAAICRGPRYGLAGLRDVTGVAAGPLLMSATKPVGLSTSQLALMASRFAEGGMDLVKDDHGLVDQRFAPWTERVRACVEAVGEGNARSGGRCIFVPNLTGSANRVRERALAAQEMGVGAVMVGPSLIGYDVVRELAADPDFRLPIISHPTFGGANVITPTTGFAHGVFFGTLQRLMGVDAVVYPNFGGRFGFSVGECREIVDASAAPLGGLKPIVVAPGGGMTLERVPEMRAVYGDDVMYLMGGALLKAGDGLADACRRLRAAVGR